MITRGNWIARIDNYSIDVIEEQTGFGICNIGTNKELEDSEYPNEEAIANAKLIAAAPNLLEVCQLMIQAFKDAPNEWLMTNDVMQAESIMMDAINKAVSTK